MDGHFRGGSFECDSCTGKDIRVVVFKVSQMHCENCEKKVKNNMRFEKGVKELSTEPEGQNGVYHLRCREDGREEVAGRIQEVQLRGGVCERNQTGRQERRQTRISKRRKESR